MVSLLDVNVLIALFDPAHSQHDAAHAWFGRNKSRGWATCPLTENGIVRILSNPTYPGSQSTVRDLTRRLERFRASGKHTFWPDSVSLREASLFQLEHVQGHRQLTDVYLLGLAVRHGGRLATLDESIPLASVTGAAGRHLALIGD